LTVESQGHEFFLHKVLRDEPIRALGGRFILKDPDSDEEDC